MSGKRRGWDFDVEMNRNGDDRTRSRNRGREGTEAIDDG